MSTTITSSSLTEQSLHSTHQHFLFSNSQFTLSNSSNNEFFSVSDDSYLYYNHPPYIITPPKKSAYFRIIKDDSNRTKESTYTNVHLCLFKPMKEIKFDHLKNSINVDNVIDMNGRKRKRKIKRKYKSDDIRKKIKSRFHKTLRIIMNSWLQKAGAKLMFDLLPQCFLSNISKKVNCMAMKMTLKEMMGYDFLKVCNKRKNWNWEVDLKKWLKNKNVLEYLESNCDICMKSGFEELGKKTYEELLKEYFRSEEFMFSLSKLKDEGEKEEYMREYTKKALKYVEYFGKNEDKEKMKEEDN